MTSRARLFLWLSTIMGLVASTAAAYVHHQLLSTPKYASFCDVNETFNCTSVYLSPYGSLFGVPVAVFGVIWFVVVVALLVAGRPGTPMADNLAGYLLVLSTVGLGVILYLAYGAFFVLKTVCFLCLATYLAVIGIFLASGSATAYPMSTLPARARRDFRAALSSPLALVALLLITAGAVSAIAFFPREATGSFADTLAASTPSASPAPTTPSPAPTATPASEPRAEAGAQGPVQQTSGLTPDEQQKLENWYNQQQRTIVPVDGGGAAVVVVKFNDYQCPPCRQTFYDFKPIRDKYAALAPGKVKFITKHFPLDSECNVNIPQGPHQAACEAAAAVVMAKDKAEVLENWLFTNQATLTPIAVRTAAKDVAGIPNFDAGYSAALDQVRSDIALGKLVNVGATPTFFVNGIKLQGGFPPQYFDALIQLELKKAGR